MATNFLSEVFEDGLVQRLGNGGLDEFGRRCADHMRAVAESYRCLVEPLAREVSCEVLVPYGEGIKGMNCAIGYTLGFNGHGMALAIRSPNGKEVRFNSGGFETVRCGIRSVGYDREAAVFNERVEAAKQALYC